MKRKMLAVLLAALVLTGCGGKQDDVPEEPAFAPEQLPVTVEPDLGLEEQGEKVYDFGDGQEPERDPREEAVEKLLESMSLEEKVGQMFFVRCPEVRVEEMIETYHLGGVLLFTRDFKDSGGEWLSEAAFVEKVIGMQGAAEVPLLIGVDEEGGTVARASRNPNLFEEKFKSPQEVFAAGGMEAIELDAIDKHRDLLRYGINVNFAPVADVSTEPGDFIYDRAFGQDAEATAEFVRTVVTAAGGVYVSDGENTFRMGCVLKHFPGYGDNVDTHTGIAVDERLYSQFLAEDFVPFLAGIEAGAGSVLVSHNVVTCMDEDLPASLSGEVHRVLREELGFEGVVLTDDLAMDAVEKYAGDGSVAVLAVVAGNDMIVTTDFEEQIPLVVDAVRTGLVDEGIIDQAVRRVLGWKFDLGLLDMELFE